VQPLLVVEPLGTARPPIRRQTDGFSADARQVVEYGGHGVDGDGVVMRASRDRAYDVGDQVFGAEGLGDAAHVVVAEVDDVRAFAAAFRQLAQPLGRQCLRRAKRRTLSVAFARVHRVVVDTRLRIEVALRIGHGRPIHFEATSAKPFSGFLTLVSRSYCTTRGRTAKPAVLIPLQGSRNQPSTLADTRYTTIAGAARRMTSPSARERPTTADAATTL
jgi:hypothetical protein